ncbi:MAG TPA: hypothetical protein VFZ26_02715, partial [Gemmatimonadales bacterium]
MKRRGSGWAAVALLASLVAACGGDSTGPATGSLAVTVAGLPSGTAADVTVTGPAGYNRALVGSETLAGLAPGNYTVTAGPISAGAQLYAGDPVSQTVVVAEGSTPATAQVAYAVSTGNLAVTVTGLPAGAAAAVTVTGPGGFEQSLSASGTLTSVAPGSYTVTAEPVSAGGSQYSPT